MTAPHYSLRSAGEALYGPNWQSEIARALGVNLRTMQRWALGAKNGGTEPPERLWEEIAALCEKRGIALLSISKSLSP